MLGIGLVLGAPGYLSGGQEIVKLDKAPLLHDVSLGLIEKEDPVECLESLLARLGAPHHPSTLGEDKNGIATDLLFKLF